MTAEQTYQYVYEKCKCVETSNRKTRYLASIQFVYSHTAIGSTEQAARHKLAYKLCYKKHIQEMVKALILLEQRSA